MNTLTRATAPRDTSGWVVASAPAPGVNPAPMPGTSPVSPFVRSSLPGTVSGMPDALRGFYSNVQRQQRFWQASSQVATQSVSSSASQARSAALQVMSGLNLNAILDTPAYSKLPSNLLSNGQLVIPTESSYRGDWDNITDYNEGDEVTDQGYLWEAAAANYDSQPSRTNVHWNLLGPSSLASYKGAWSSGGIYNPGEETADAGYVWQCTNVVGPSSTHPASDPSHWVQIGPANLQNFQGAWTAGTYQAGMEVSYSAYIWQANTTTTSQPGADGTWNQIGPSNINNYQGTYNGGAYLSGQQVGYSGNVYLATQNVPAGQSPTNASYWVLVGPNTIDSVADGTAYGKVTKNALTTGGVIDFGNGAGWFNRVLDYLPDGPNWQKVKSVTGNQTTSPSYSSGSLGYYASATISGAVVVAEGATSALFSSDIATDNTGGSSYIYVLIFSGVFSTQDGTATLYPVLTFTMDGGNPASPGFIYPLDTATDPITVVWATTTNPGHTVNINCQNNGHSLSVYGTLSVLTIKS